MTVTLPGLLATVLAIPAAPRKIVPAVRQRELRLTGQGAALDS
jgi:hypothetical protein